MLSKILNAVDSCLVRILQSRVLLIFRTARTVEPWQVAIFHRPSNSKDTMKLSIAALLIASASAFAPNAMEVWIVKSRNSSTNASAVAHLHNGPSNGPSRRLWLHCRCCSCGCSHYWYVSISDFVYFKYSNTIHTASADGAVSGATVGRARGIYGNRIAALKEAVDKGDLAAVAQEKNAFVLFNSGVYPGAKNKDLKAAAVEGTNAIFAAIRNGDKAGLKSAYTAYVGANEISPLPDVKNSNGQGYSGDFDYRSRTSAGAIYVR